MKRFKLLLGFFISLFTYVSYGNDIEISNVDVTGLDVANAYAFVEFDISWENSWNEMASGTFNRDAAWVFVKYSTDGGITWYHAYLHNSGNSPGTGGTAAVQVGLLDETSAFDESTNPAMGAFLYRTDVGGNGTLSLSDVQLRWNFAENGNNALTGTETIDIKVFAIEMVLAPTALFWLGIPDSSPPDGEVYLFGHTDSAVPVTSENGIPVNSGGGVGTSITYPAGAEFGDNSGPISREFPKGFAGFYLMKYEMSQQQYVDFLNTLTLDQQTVRTAVSPLSAAGTRVMGSTNRNEVRILTSGVNPGTPAVYETGNPHVAMNYISWMDGAAYTDWAGLRPFTEMEYEKACKGITTPFEFQTASGHNSSWITTPDYTLANEGGADEGIATNYATAINRTNILVNVNSGASNTPYRVGIFAANANNAGRAMAGAAFYGMMEMAGNVTEQVVTFGNAEGRAFEGSHGDGRLSDNGNASDQDQGSSVIATTTDWPGYSTGALTNEVDDATGSGIKGGSFGAGVEAARVGYRRGVVTGVDVRNARHGYRCARIEPTSAAE